MNTRAALQLAMAAVSLALGLGMGTQLRTALTIRSMFGVLATGVKELASR